MFLRSLIVAALVATPLTAQTDIRPDDADRLAAFDAHFGAAIRHAMSLGARGDIDLLQDALSGGAIPALRTTLTGDWKCRTLSLGGETGLTSFAQFDCRFSADGAGFIFEKQSGTARSQGRVSLMGGQMIYLGTGFGADMDPIPYADLPQTPEDGAQQPQIGVVEQSGPDSARILFPAPPTGAQFDLLFLTR